MQLWTEQAATFALSEGQRRPDMSKYRDEITRHYEELHRRVGHDQFLWCTREVPNEFDLRNAAANGKVYYQLDVPPSGIVKIVDGIVWNRILGIQCSLPQAIRYRFDDEAANQFPHDIAAQRARRSELEEAFWLTAPPNGSWWSALFIDDISRDPNGQVLVTFPLHPSWIVRTLSDVG